MLTNISLRNALKLYNEVLSLLETKMVELGEP